MTAKLFCILSLPRSGSTVLTAELDRFHGVICLPESAFPQMLAVVSEAEWADSRRMAAMFLVCSFSGTVLSLEEAERCITGNRRETLVNLGLACARKTGRDEGAVRTVIWKSTRLTSLWRSFAGLGGRYCVLRRNPVNVHDSQFRVGFGLNNRKPLRFALFSESYEWAFSHLPAETFHLEYEKIPGRLADLLQWMGAVDRPWSGGASSFVNVAAGRPWHAEILKGFKSTDDAKRAAVPFRRRVALAVCRRVVRPFRPLLGPLRRHYDSQAVATIRHRTETLLQSV